MQCVVYYNVTADVSEVKGPVEVFGHGVKWPVIGTLYSHHLAKTLSLYQDKI